MSGQTYSFYATVREVYDGDTLYGWVSLGLGIWDHGASAAGVGLRLNGCNARELSAPGGKEARDHLASLIPVGTVLPITSVSWDKYGNRLDVTITMPDGSDLVSTLVAWPVGRSLGRHRPASCAALAANGLPVSRVGLAIVAGLTTVALVVLEAIDRRHPFHAADRGVRLLDRLRDRARL